MRGRETIPAVEEGAGEWRDLNLDEMGGLEVARGALAVQELVAGRGCAVFGEVSFGWRCAKRGRTMFGPVCRTGGAGGMERIPVGGGLRRQSKIDESDNVHLDANSRRGRSGRHSISRRRRSSGRRGRRRWGRRRRSPRWRLWHARRRRPIRHAWDRGRFRHVRHRRYHTRRHNSSIRERERRDGTLGLTARPFPGLAQRRHPVRKQVAQLRRSSHHIPRILHRHPALSSSLARSTSARGRLVLAAQSDRAVQRVRGVDRTSGGGHGGDALLHSGHSSATGGGGGLAVDHRGGLVDCLCMA